MNQLSESHSNQFIGNNPLNVTTSTIINMVDQLLEKYNLQETDFKISTNGWTEKKDSHGKKYLENMEGDVWEVEINGEKIQLFTWEAAMRETKAQGESMPIIDDLRCIETSNQNLKKSLGLNIWQLYFLGGKYPQVGRCKNITYWTGSSIETKILNPIIGLDTAYSVGFTSDNGIVLNEHPLDTIGLPVRCISRG